jgi:hypothetical protein
MVSKRGRGGFVTKGTVTDARFKIIAKKRLQMVDARDQLAQLAKQTDARDKLNHLRVYQRGSGGLQLKTRGGDNRGRSNQASVHIFSIIAPLLYQNETLLALLP